VLELLPTLDDELDDDISVVEVVPLGAMLLDPPLLEPTIDIFAGVVVIGVTGSSPPEKA